MPHLQANYKTFWLHLTLLFSHCAIMTVCQSIIYQTFSKTDEKALRIQNYARIVLFTSMTIIQLIFIYMFNKFMKPNMIQIKFNISNEPIQRMRTLSEMYTDARTDSLNSRDSLNSDVMEQSRLNIAAVCREMWGDEETDLRQNVFA